MYFLAKDKKNIAGREWEITFMIYSPTEKEIKEADSSNIFAAIKKQEGRIYLRFFPQFHCNPAFDGSEFNDLLELRHRESDHAKHTKIFLESSYEAAATKTFLEADKKTRDFDIVGDDGSRSTKEKIINGLIACLESTQTKELESLQTIVEQIIVRPECRNIASTPQKTKIEQAQTALSEILRQKKLDKKLALFF